MEEDLLLTGSQPVYLSSTDEQAQAALTQRMVERGCILSASSIGLSSDDFKYSHTFEQLANKNKQRSQSGTDFDADEESKEEWE